MNKQVQAALATHQDVPTSSTNGTSGGKQRVMVIGELLSVALRQCACNHVNCVRNAMT